MSGFNARQETGGAVDSVNNETDVVVLDASEIDAAATPTNYTAATADVEAHLSGIDDALASAGGTKTSGSGTQGLSFGATLTIAHGLGTTPTRFRFSMVAHSASGIAQSVGVKTSSGEDYFAFSHNYTSGYFNSNHGARLALLETGSGNNYYADSVSWDDTNVTIVFAESGSPTGSGHYFWEAE